MNLPGSPRPSPGTSLRPFMVSLALASLLTLVGVTGYRVLEGWSWLDSFYMVFITLSTVGFSEVHEMGPEGRLWTIFLVVCGVTLVGYTAARAIEFFTDSTFQIKRRRRRMQSRIDRMQDHFIVCGWGRVGQQISEDLAEAGHEMVVIENEDEGGSLGASGIDHVLGGAEHEATLELAGIRRARVLFAAVDGDTENVIITLTARQLNPSLRVIARASDAEAGRKLQLVGAERVVSPYLASGRRMSHLALRPQAVDLFDTLGSPLAAIGVEIHEMAIEPTSTLAGKSLKEIDLRRSTGVIVVALRQSGKIELNPDPDAVITAGCSVLAMGTAQQCADLGELVHGAASSQTTQAQ